MSVENKDNTLGDENEKLEVEAEKQADVAEAQSPQDTSEADADTEAQDMAQLLSTAQEESADLRDKMMRLAADYENFKKRMERERLIALKYSGEQIFREILPVVDNLERAIGQGVVEGADAEKNLAALLEGVQLTLKSLVATLEKFEVKPIEAVGKPFDPNQEEALTMEASDTVPANHVLQEFEKGYFFKDRLLRAARVVVSSGKAQG